MSPHLQRAYLLYDQRRYDLAEKEVGQALLADPNDGRSLALLALCLLEQQKFTEATQRAQEAVGNAPDESFSHYTLARVWIERNYLDQAELEIQAALAIDPHFPHYHVTLGLIHYRRSAWPLALAAAEAALSLKPDHADAVSLRTEALRKLGRKDAAREHLHEQLARDPDDPYTHVGLGWNYLEKGNRDKAMEHFREALRLDPELDWAREGVVETLKSKSRFYRGVMRYFFWISRFSPQVQLALMVGLFIGYRVLVGILADQPQLAPLFWTVVVGYGVFVFSTWFARPLFNLLLLPHPFGRLALSRDDRWCAMWVGMALATGVALMVIAAIWRSDRTFLIAFHGASAAFTVMCTFSTATPWPRRAMLVYMAIVLALAGTSISMLLLQTAIHEASPALFEQAAGLLRLIDRLMIWNPLISTLGPSLLMQYQPRRH
ncbi:MAG: tetratricopeptide repeat protein [Pirellulales bacterium]